MAEQLFHSSTNHSDSEDSDNAPSCSFVSSITGDTLEKAIQELKEDPLTRLQVITELREKINSWKPTKTEEKTVTFINKEDKFLLRFLRARKFNVDKALQLYVNYYTFRHKNSEILDDLNLKSTEQVFHRDIIKVLDTRFRDGSKAICVYPGHWNSEEIPFVDNFRATLLVLDRLIQDEETQVNGISVVYDFTGASFMSVFKVAQSELITKGVLIELLQDSFPARFKGVHLMHQPWYVSIVLGIIKPFMKQKLSERIQSHGEDHESLNTYIDISNLPKELGGSAECTGSSNNTLELFR